jgi:phage tail-like protein
VTLVPLPDGRLEQSRPRPASRPARSAYWLLNQLPVGLLDSDFFVRFVSIFQELGGTLLDDADNIENLLDLTVTPPGMLRWLGAWIGVDSVDPSLPEDLQRLIVTGSATSLRWRGTRRGLLAFLEMTTGGQCEVEDGGGVWPTGEAPRDVAWVRLRVQSTGWLEERDFIALVRDELPAHARAELYVGDRLAWSSAWPAASSAPGGPPVERTGRMPVGGAQ